MEELWKPSPEEIEQANMTHFMEYVNKRYRLSLSEYKQLYEWSIANIEPFWEAMWDFVDIIHSQPYNEVFLTGEEMLDCHWFVGARLNFAENLLRYRDRQTAVIFMDEAGHRERLSYADLYAEVSRLAQALRQSGVQAGDRVAAYLPNLPQAVIAMLASSSIGAVWSSCSPDFGFKGVIDRFGQIEPTILFCSDGYYYNGKRHDILSRVAKVKEEISSIQQVIVIPYLKEKPDLSNIPAAVLYGDFMAEAREGELEFTQLPFDHPLYIMYSSGTTGAPKCMVHGAGGTLIQHLKELVLHTDLQRRDTIFYYTSCGWMMWNWLVSSLAVGATLFLYDGSPFYPDARALLRLVQNEGISIFGTSARYLISIEKAGLHPGQEFDLSVLRAILSTGSPLPAEIFHYVYKEIKSDLLLASISGGTDIISCFALGNPIGPVYPGELQCRGLGMSVEAFDENGESVIGQKGELVCTTPFPSMPIYYWNDPGQEKYRQAYFSLYPGVWSHGDYVEISPDGGIIIYGRSDATLNPGGVRIGTAEIYRQVENFVEIADSVAVAQSWDNDVRVVLFLKLNPGYELNNELIERVKEAIRVNTSPRHVPAKVIAVDDIPYTLNGKKIEVAVKKVIANEPILNLDALANPEALDCFRNLPELQDSYGLI